MTEIPVPLITTATAALKRLEDAPYGADHTERAIAVLTAVWPALRTAARVELNREVESLQSAWRARLAKELHEKAEREYGSYCDGMHEAADYVAQDAPTAPAQPATPREKHCGELLNHPPHPYQRLGQDRTCPGGSAALLIYRGDRPTEEDRRLLRKTLQDSRRAIEAHLKAAQPAAPATGDAETTGGAASPTDDLNALWERIASALTTACPKHHHCNRQTLAVIAAVRPELEMVTLRWRTAMGAVEALRERAEQAEREAREYRTANTTLQQINVLRTERAEKAEAAVERLRNYTTRAREWRCCDATDWTAIADQLDNLLAITQDGQ